MFFSRLVMLLDRKKAVTWIIQILCKVPFYTLIVDYFKSELRLYTHAVFLEAFFPAIESLLILIVSNKNTILMFTVIFIFLCLFCAVGLFKQLTNKPDNNIIVFLSSIFFLKLSYILS